MLISKTDCMIELKSKISEVVVYPQLALVKRVATHQFNAGKHEVCFETVPHEMVNESVQLTGEGNAMIYDVEVETVYIKEVTNEQAETARKKLVEKSKAKELLEIETEVTDKKYAFLERMLATVTNDNQKQVNFNPLDWHKMLEFYGQQLKESAQKKYTLQEKIEAIEVEINALELLIADADEYKYKKRIKCILAVENEQEVLLQTAYMMPGASWTPKYDVRANGTSKSLKIDYSAFVTQKTGEDWIDSKIFLSTATPHSNQKEPELRAWNIGFERFISGGNEKMDMMLEAREPALAPKMEMARSMKKEKALPKIQKPQATVQADTTSVKFEITNNQTILSNNKQHSLTIYSADFQSEFIYSTVPKLTEDAFLKAKCKNSSDYPFLPGKTHIFLDNHFVGNAFMKSILPNEEFDIDLGIDKAIKVEHKQLKKYHSDEGLFNKKNKYVFEYLITVENLKKTAELLKVKDQIPTSQDENLSVNLISPKIKENSENLKKTTENFIEWKFELKPLEKKEIELVFAIEYPKNETITGISL